MSIPESIIDDVRRSADIVDVISPFVRLRKRGKNYIGLCPFHQEKTPSFNVNPQMGIYKCFGCGKGGNVFTFLMEVEKVSFVESVRSLAERYGIRMPENAPSTNKEESTDTEQLYAALRFAGNFYYTYLSADNKKSKFIREEYFKKQRGLTDETLKTFALGASPDGWEGFLGEARKAGFSDDALVKAGLAKRREGESSIYDAFRNRAMFPIVGVTGRVIGFGARKVFEDDKLAKYINSPESPVYNKSAVLYGLFQSKDEIRRKDSALLVEGYMDLISLWQHGVRNAVASSGTSLTEGQVELLARYTNNITIVYDSDSAGAAAAMRGVDLLLAGGFHVRVLSLPTGDDPDSFVQREGKDVFLEKVERAATFLEYKAGEMQKNGMFDAPERQAAAVRTLVETIAKIPDPLERTFSMRSIADKFHLYETDLLRELEKHIQSKYVHDRRRSIAEQQEPATAHAPESQAEQDVPPYERELLRTMIKGGKRVSEFVLSEVSPSQFRSPLAAQMAEILAEYMHEHGAIHPENLVNEAAVNTDPALQEFLAGLLFENAQPGERWESFDRPNKDEDLWRIASDTVRAFRISGLREQRRELEERLKTSNTHPVESGAQFLLLEIMEIDKKIRELDTPQKPHEQRMTL